MTLVFALTCFAANSLLCRLALSSGEVDAPSFTTLRLVSGALVLGFLARGRSRPKTGPAPAAALLLYAACFSFAYVELPAATGALVLFAAVQVTMLVGAALSGERPGLARGAGMVVAAAGVSYLLAPGVEAPSLSGVLLMLAAGVGWGLYSLAGRGTKDPLAATSRHFLIASLPSFGLAALSSSPATITLVGLTLAVASGALASGVGYALWLSALNRLTVSSAAVVQLAVPVLAAFGAAVFLSESISGRLVVASILVLGGVAVALSAPTRTTPAGTSVEAPESLPAESPRAARRREAPASIA